MRFYGKSNVVDLAIHNERAPGRSKKIDRSY